jgi:opacity protein-like surface antigen
LLSLARQMRRTNLHALSIVSSAAAICLAALSYSPSARAETVIATDIDYATAPSSSAVRDGTGYAIRVGQEFRESLASATPEIVFAYTGFSGVTIPSVYRGMAGLRLGFGDVLRPGAFVHLGVARVLGSEPFSALEPSRTAFTYDVGASLDLAAIPHVIVGAHVEYSGIASTSVAPGLDWIGIGGHFGISF